MGIYYSNDATPVEEWWFKTKLGYCISGGNSQMTCRKFFPLLIGSDLVLIRDERPP